MLETLSAFPRIFLLLACAIWFVTGSEFAASQKLSSNKIDEAIKNEVITQKEKEIEAHLDQLDTASTPQKDLEIVSQPDVQDVVDLWMLQDGSSVFVTEEGIYIVDDTRNTKALVSPIGGDLGAASSVRLMDSVFDRARNEIITLENIQTSSLGPPKTDYLSDPQYGYSYDAPFVLRPVGSPVPVLSEFRLIRTELASGKQTLLQELPSQEDEFTRDIVIVGSWLALLTTSDKTYTARFDFIPLQSDLSEPNPGPILVEISTFSEMSIGRLQYDQARNRLLHIAGSEKEGLRLLATSLGAPNSTEVLFPFSELHPGRPAVQYEISPSGEYLVVVTKVYHDDGTQDPFRITKVPIDQPDSREVLFEASNTWDPHRLRVLSDGSVFLYGNLERRLTRKPVVDARGASYSNLTKGFVRAPIVVE